MINGVIREAEEKMWPTSKKDKEVAMLNKLCPGGIISIYIGRSTIGAGNTEYFRVVVKDANGSEVINKELKEDTPEVPGSDELWWNIASVWLPKTVKLPLEVFVIDELDDTNPKHHFVVQ